MPPIEFRETPWRVSRCPFAPIGSAEERRITMSEMTSQIREHMAVVASCGKHVGTVDRVEGKHLKLTRDDNPTRSGEHAFLPLGSVGAIRDGEIHLNINSEEAKAAATSSAS
jgi:hypothetical protein